MNQNRSRKIFTKIFKNKNPPKGRFFKNYKKFTIIIPTSPRRIEIPNPIKTFFPKFFSHIRYAIDALTILLDMVAIRIVVDAITSESEPSSDFPAISIVIASTSAKPEIIPST